MYILSPRSLPLYFCLALAFSGCSDQSLYQRLERDGELILLTRNSPTTYYFDGDHRRTTSQPWEDAFGLKVRRIRYANGNLYELGFEDRDILDDFNDLELQVAILQPIP